MQQEFNIRALTGDDWKDFRALRLQALRRNRRVFGSTYELESAWEDSDWRGLLESRDAIIFGGFEGKDLIALSAVFRWREDTRGKTALLGMWYMREDRRGGGRFETLTRAAIAWAEAQMEYERIIVSHRAGNDASRHMNQKLRFVYTHSKTSAWADGESDEHHYYERKIER